MPRGLFCLHVTCYSGSGKSMDRGARPLGPGRGQAEGEPPGSQCSRRTCQALPAAQCQSIPHSHPQGDR